MVTIIIRHADDNEDTPTHRHDQEITDRGKRKAKEKALRLIDRYGQPDIIYCSPMMRTRQTLAEMLKYVKSKPIIYFDNRISRYFSSREQKEPSVFTVTNQRNIPIYETYDKFKHRCDKFLREIKDKNYIYTRRKVIWVISHTLVIKRITSKLHMRIHSYLNFLESYRLRQ